MKAKYVAALAASLMLASSISHAMKDKERPNRAHETKERVSKLQSENKDRTDRMEVNASKLDTALSELGSASMTLRNPAIAKSVEESVFAVKNKEILEQMVNGIELAKTSMKDSTVSTEVTRLREEAVAESVEAMNFVADNIQKNKTATESDIAFLSLTSVRLGEVISEKAEAEATLKNYIGFVKASKDVLLTGKTAEEALRETAELYVKENSAALEKQGIKTAEEFLTELRRRCGLA